MKILELFAGSQSFSKVAREMNLKTFTSDIADIPGIDYNCDILDFEVEKVPFIPNIIWASPDCATWSKASGAIHFNSKSLKPKTEKARKAFFHVDKTFSIIDFFLSKNPDLKFYVENPVGRLAKYLQPETLFNPGLRVVTLDQCQYGREFQKTTHIFTNDYTWTTRQRCPGRPACNHKPNIKNHATGQRTSLGTMDNLTYYKRAMIPADLVKEIINHNLKNQI